MNRNSIYIRVLLVILAIVVVLTFVGRSPQRSSRDNWLPSSFNPVGAGHMAFFQTLQEMGWPVERWRDPLIRLSNFGTGNILVITRARVGSRVSFSEQEDQLLDDWIKSGNTLVLLGAMQEWDDTRELLAQIGYTLPPKKDSVTSFLEPFQRDAARPITVDPGPGQSGTMVLPRTDALPVLAPPHTKILWQSGSESYLVSIARGGGRVIYGASEEILNNRYLGRGENLAIVLGLLAPGGVVPPHIFFEESHHGFSAVYALAHLFEHPGVRFAGMLALLGAVAFLGSSLVRFGPIVPLQRESGRSTLEFVDSIADLYLRADQRNETMKILFFETHQRVLQRLNLPPTASHELIAARLLQGHPQLPKWKKLAQRFDSRDYVDGLPPSGWLRVARDLIEIKSAMA